MYRKLRAQLCTGRVFSHSLIHPFRQRLPPGCLQYARHWGCSWEISGRLAPMQTPGEDAGNDGASWEV